RRGVMDALDRLDIERQKPGERQIDDLGFGKRNRVVERPQMLDVLGVERHGLVGAKPGPFGERKGQIGGESALFRHAQSLGRAAFSASPDCAVRRSSSSVTSDSATPWARNRTSRW